MWRRLAEEEHTFGMAVCLHKRFVNIYLNCVQEKENEIAIPTGDTRMCKRCTINEKSMRINTFDY